jgi:hypothetical protein
MSAQRGQQYRPTSQCERPCGTRNQPLTPVYDRDSHCESVRPQPTNNRTRKEGDAGGDAVAIRGHREHDRAPNRSVKISELQPLRGSKHFVSVV